MRSLPLLSAALAISSCTLPIDRWVAEENLTNFSSSEPAGTETYLNASVDLSVGRLTIQAGDGSARYSLEVHYNEAAFEPKVDSRLDGETAYVTFELSGEGKLAPSAGKTQVDLSLDPGKRLRLNTQTGVGESEVDLTGMAVEGIDLEAGVGESTISMLTPNRIRCREVKVRNGVGALQFTGLGNLNFEQFTFKGGVGATTLDFSGSWENEASVDIQVGVGGVEILLPRHIGVELHLQQSLFSGFDISGFRKRGEIYYSDNLEQVERTVQFNIRTGIGGVEIRWI